MALLHFPSRHQPERHGQQAADKGRDRIATQPGKARIPKTSEAVAKPEDGSSKSETVPIIVPHSGQLDPIVSPTRS